MIKSIFAGLVAVVALATTPALAEKARRGAPTVYTAVNEPTAKAAPTRGVYQAQIFLTCSTGSCSGSFPALTAKQRLDLDQMICYASASSSTYLYEAYGYNSGLYYDLGLDRQSSDGAGLITWVFQQDGPFIVRKGTILSATIVASGPGISTAYCSVYGEIVVYP